MNPSWPASRRQSFQQAPGERERRLQAGLSFLRTGHVEISTRARHRVKLHDFLLSGSQISIALLSGFGLKVLGDLFSIEFQIRTKKSVLTRKRDVGKNDFANAH